MPPSHRQPARRRTSPRPLLLAVATSALVACSAGSDSSADVQATSAAATSAVPTSSTPVTYGTRVFRDVMLPVTNRS